MTKFFKVTYRTINWGAYYGGSNDYIVKAEKFFTTREKAQAFVDAKIEEVKIAGDGEITEIEAE